MLNWLAAGRSSARACDTGMLIRSFAVTAAAAAFLVWRVFFQGRDGPGRQDNDQQASDNVPEAASSRGTAADAAPSPGHADAEDGQPAQSGPAGDDQPAAAHPSSDKPGSKAFQHVDIGQSVGKQELLRHAQDGPTSPGISTANDNADSCTSPEGIITVEATTHDPERSQPAANGDVAEDDEDAPEQLARRTLSSQLPSAPPAQSVAQRQAQHSSPRRAAAAHAATQSADGGQPKLYLQVLTGPAASTTFSSLDRQLLSVKIGRMANCELAINDQEVSGRHAAISFSEERHCWFLADLGSLNGTLLNSAVISREGRQRSEQHALADHDVVQLGTNTQIRVRCHPSPARPHQAGAAAGAHPVASARNLSPRQQAAAATLPVTAAHPALRLSAATLTRTGLLHVRHGSACEDVATWQLPFPHAPSSAAAPAHPPAIGTTVDSSFKQLATSQDSAAPASSSSSGGGGGSRAAGLFCVFDGHGGGACSAQARTVVPAAVAREFGGLHPMLLPVAAGQGVTRAEAWERAYLAADAELACDEGCTATTVLVERQEGARVAVQAANVGDSTAVLVVMRGDPAAFPAAPPAITQLSHEHKVAEASENARLRARGFQGKTRLYGLALSRSLGDKFLKDQDVGLLAVPHVSEAVSIEAEEEAVVVLASDGLWDVVSCEAAGNAAARILHGANGSAAAVAEALMQMALVGRSQDDITVMALHIQRAGPVHL